MYSLSSNDIVWLLLGLLPVLLTVVRIGRFGANAGITLASVGTLALWIGYHLTPWLSLRTGGWGSFLLRGEEVTGALQFSTLCMWGLNIGYGTLGKRPLAEVSDIGSSIREIVDRVPPYAVLALIFIAAALKPLSIGSIQEFWAASIPRGYGQFENKNAVQQFIAQLSTASSLLGVLSSFLVGYKVGAARAAIFLIPIGFVGVAFSSASLWYDFSRASGANVLIFSLALAMSWGARGFGGRLLKISTITSLVIFGFYLNIVGITQRDSYPGFSNFIERTLRPVQDNFEYVLDESGGGLVVGPNINLFNAIDAYTTLMSFQDKKIDILGGLYTFVMVISPIPTFIIMPKYEIGGSLTDFLGTYGSTGITTPSLAQINVLFGDYGVFVFMAMGFAFSKIDKGRVRNSAIYYLVLLFIAAAFVVGLHSGLRAFSRPMVYAAVVVLITSRLRRKPVPRLPGYRDV